jgi:hypothetical protein
MLAIWADAFVDLFKRDEKGEKSTMGSLNSVQRDEEISCDARLGRQFRRWLPIHSRRRRTGLGSDLSEACFVGTRTGASELTLVDN